MSFPPPVRALWALAVPLAAAAWSTSPEPSARGEVVRREAWAMGTRVLVIAEAATTSRSEASSEAALVEIERFERLLSTWDPTSELSRLNASPLERPVRISFELAGILREAEAAAWRTGRAFDPTVGALVDLWGRGGSTSASPTEADVASARAHTGALVMHVEGEHATRRSARAWIDSGAFGKGAALRSIARGISLREGERLLVDLGGQLWASASPDAPWTVDIAHPRERSRTVARLSLYGVSAATSGASERPGHIVDPRSGVPVPAWGSVTVVGDDPFEADALSTALYVMGPQEGLAWAREEGVAALFLEVGERGLGATWTEEMERWLEVGGIIDKDNYF